ncbi:MAG: pyruvate kinase alpha/beta domain-containing protein [Desulfitobacteriaceae bacterium]|nr:pyruvate kinase alpha/beta domain-containing protein [Desulfitobacteriaceae bacterium]MDI6878935.1 pyruvate kinase alpha/beta domain-containing protein [Desulfitobacteriaceae bacterium]MDI6914853.1 pyruvate kinase alpha/beta domain-containing protein [Desulfitobacteriaceae bacterium]
MNVIFFERPGRENTEKAIALAVERARELGITTLVVASNSGDTVKRCLGHGLEVVCVTHHVGFTGPGIDEMSAEVRADLAAKGVKVLTATHLFAGVDRALRIQAGGLYPGEIVGHTLRMFGQGVKVGVECAVMALDAGLIEYGKPVVALGGTGRGADTAIVLTPQHSNQFFSTKIHEIICKPR